MDRGTVLATKTRAMADTLALGFGATVAMWMVGYLCRMPPASVPSPAVLLLMLACVVGGGYQAGRYTSHGWKAGLQSGLAAALLNLLILGSLLRGDEAGSFTPAAAVWLPGWLVLAGFLGAAGGAWGMRNPNPLPSQAWTASFSKVAVAATFFLIIAGGLVTSYNAGLAVVDWPNSFGYNMFLYPLSRMTGGIYYEHAHRLFGSLVGLTTLALTIHLFMVEKRRWTKVLASVALIAVISQGIMGGLRVTGKFTLSASPSDTAPNLTLAVIHGVFGQMFLGLMVVLAVVTSTSWLRGSSAGDCARRKLDQKLAAVLLLALLVQIVLGAVQRHFGTVLLHHLFFAAVVAILAIISGTRAWGYYPAEPNLRRFGGALLYVTTLQLVIGFGALIATLPFEAKQNPSTAFEVWIPTAHQAIGAILVANVVALLMWLFRSHDPLDSETAVVRKG